MLIFGVDMPLLEIVLAFAIIILLILIEAIVIIALISKQLSKMRTMGELLEKLSDVLLKIKEKEILELNLVRRR